MHTPPVTGPLSVNLTLTMDVYIEIAMPNDLPLASLYAALQRAEDKLIRSGVPSDTIRVDAGDNAIVVKGNVAIGGVS